MTLLPSLAFLCFAFAPAFAGIETKTAPIEIDIPEARWAEMSPQARAAIETLRRELVDSTWLFEDVKVELPESVFDDGAVILSENDVFPRPPDGGEDLQALAYDEKGIRKRLDGTQYDQLRAHGEFIVPSRRYPGRNHVWKMTWGAQVGSENIRIKFEDARNAAIDQLVVHFPARWCGRDFSVCAGARRFGRGFRGLLATTVGLVERVPKYTDQQVEALITKRAQGELQLLNPTLDFRLYDAKLMQRAHGILGPIVSEMDRAWRKIEAEQLDVILPPLREKGLSGDELARAAQAELTERRRQIFWARLASDENLEKLSPGLGALMVNRERANILTEHAAVEADLSAQAFADEWRAAYVKRHPWLARNQKRLERKLAPKLAAFRLEARRAWADHLVTALQEAGLEQEATILRANIEFYANEAEDVRREYGAQEIAAREFQFRTPILRSRDWIATAYENERKETRYRAEKHHVRTLNTNWPGWRNALFALRVNEAFWTWNHWMVVNNLVNGPLGLRALASPEPFLPHRVMDPVTKDISPDPKRPRATLWSRQRQIWARVGERNQQFEASPDRGIIRKDTKRPWMYGYSYVQGGVQSAVYGLAQLGLTVVNVPASAACVAASPVLSLGYAMACDIADLFFDRTQTKFGRAVNNSLPVNLLRPPLGVIEGVTAAVTSVGHLLASPVIYGAGGAWAKVKTWKDDAANYLLKLEKADVPFVDEKFVLYHQAGPGVRASYAYQVTPKVALVVLTATLERLELELFSKRLDQVLREPVQNAQRQVDARFGALVSAQPGAWMRSVNDSVSAASEKVRAQLQERLRRVPQIDVAKRDVHLNAADFEPTLDAAAEVTRAFWARSEERPNWREYGLNEGDYAGLAKRLLGNVFGAQFTEPLAPDDDTYVIGVTEPDLGHVLGEILDGTDVDVAKLEGERIVTPVPVRPPVKADPRLPNPEPLAGRLDREPCDILLKH